MECTGFSILVRRTEKLIFMKILRVINSLAIGGAERSIVGNVPLHIKNGYKIDVLLLNGKETFFVNELKRQGIRVYFLGKNNNIYNPLLILKIIRFINNYDIIHAHLFPTLYWVALAKIISFSKTKLVYTEHSTSNRRRNNWLLKSLDRIIYRQYETIIAISQSANENLAKHLGYQANIKTVYNGVNISEVKNEGKIELKEFAIKHKKNCILLQIAGFREEKDQDTLIRALQLLPDNYVAIFIGDGKRRANCEKLSKMLSLENRVDYLGFQNNVGAYINLAEAVVISSHHEGFGRAAVEGMALGKPVIASNVPGLADVVFGAGLLFEVGDYKKLSEIILKLTNNRQYYKQIANQCFERANEFDIANMVSQYEGIYNNLNRIIGND